MNKIIDNHLCGGCDRIISGNRFFCLSCIKKAIKKVKKEIVNMNKVVYLASSFDLKSRVISLAEQLKKHGIGVTVEWWNHDFKEIDVPDSEWYNSDKIKWVKERNFKGIDDADAFILVCPDNVCKKFNGANIELGYAIGKGKPVFRYGNVERSAMYHGVGTFADVDGLINRIVNL